MSFADDVRDAPFERYLPAAERARLERYGAGSAERGSDQAQPAPPLRPKDERSP